MKLRLNLTASTFLFTSLVVLFIAGCKTSSRYAFSGSTVEPVGFLSTNRYYTPANQVLTPVGLQVDLPGIRPQALALSPDGRLLVTSGKTHELVVVDPVTGKILQRVPLPAENGNDTAPEAVSTQILKPDKQGQLSFTGLIFSPEGSRLYLANVNGSIKVFRVGCAAQSHRLVLDPPAHGTKAPAH